MDYRVVFEVSSAGMQYELRRLELATQNLANMNIAAAPGTPAYQPLRAMTRPVDLSFQRLMDQGSVTGAARTIMDQPVLVDERLQSDPGHPFADAKGMVRYPGVNHAQEMLTIMSAFRAYEANVAAASVGRAMAVRALDIGGQS